MVPRWKTTLSKNIDLRFLTLQQAAEMLRMSNRTIQRLIHRKELPAFKVGGQWRFRESELAKWLQGLQEL